MVASYCSAVSIIFWLPYIHIQTMKLWLLQVMEDLYKVPCTSVHQNGRRMASVLSVMLCFHYLISKYVKMDTIKLDKIALMVSMLKISPDVEQRKCPDYDYVNAMMQPQDKKPLAEAILHFCNQLHHETSFGKIEWLYAIPLLHFLQGVGQPFGNPELDPHEMKWGDASLGLRSLRQKTYTGDFK